VAIMWPEALPRFVGPLALKSDSTTGGGRAYVATSDIQPGQRLIAETPYVHWTEQGYDEGGTLSDDADTMVEWQQVWIGLCSILARKDRAQVCMHCGHP
jgi:hypothetical protein